MILIQKSAPPSGLLELKKDAEAQGLSDKEGYEKLRNPLKSEVRDQLMREQGHLCAYCMREIPDVRVMADNPESSGAFIEHWMARSADNPTPENKGLDYFNMLAVCSGNEKAPEANGGKKKRFLTCDRKRENKALKINPLDAATLATLSYTPDGKIKSSDPVIERDIDSTLNLNCDSSAVRLPQSRKEALDAIQESIFNECKDEDYLQKCTEYLHIFEEESDPKTPYSGIVIWWLKDQIRAMSET